MSILLFFASVSLQTQYGQVELDLLHLIYQQQNLSLNFNLLYFDETSHGKENSLDCGLNTREIGLCLSLAFHAVFAHRCFYHCVLPLESTLNMCR